ncbi:MAG: hypothetical protein U1E45_21860 [Geminicoccaceae bacterium]
MTSRRFVAAVLAVILAVAVAPAAEAYIGPGAGITMLGALWGVIVAVFLAIGAVVFWPIRAFMRARKARIDKKPGTVASGTDARS